LDPKGESNTRLAGERAGGHNSDDWAESLALCVLSVYSVYSLCTLCTPPFRLYEAGHPSRQQQHKSIKDTMLGLLNRVTGKEDEKRKLSRNLNV
jgi:hypothetical protein